jgi:hypothetical protein
VEGVVQSRLLFSYINLNEKKSYKFLLSAFVDLVAVMRRRPKTAPARPQSVRTVTIGREVRKKMKEMRERRVEDDDEDRNEECEDDDEVEDLRRE